MRPLLLALTFEVFLVSRPIVEDGVISSAITSVLFGLLAWF